MGAQLNIKDPRTIELARELAEADGTSITQTIRSALEQVAAAREAMIQERIAKFNAVLADVRQHLPPQWEGKTSREIINELYDEQGLPK